MHTIIHPLKSDRSRSRLARGASKQQPLRKPHYDCTEHAEAVELTVYVPGVDASGVEITCRGPDLIITACEAHLVRVNWQALHLEGSQRDYQLVLRLGSTIDYTRLQAELVQGVLTLHLPKKSAVRRNSPTEALAQVA